MSHRPNTCPITDCGGRLEPVGKDREIGYEVWVCRKCYQQATKIGSVWWPCRFHMPRELIMEVVG